MKLFGKYDLPRYAIKNRQEVEGSTLAGCFCCRTLFKPQEIKDYTDGGKTCLCPYCDTDAVVGNMGLEDALDEEVLRKANFYWYDGKTPPPKA